MEDAMDQNWPRFQINDAVVCVQPCEGLKYGHAYNVVCRNNGNEVGVDAPNTGWISAHRFILRSEVDDFGLLASEAAKSEAESQGFYTPETQKLFQQLKASRERVQQLLEKNNQYLEDARKARRETETLRLTLAAVEGQRDHLAAVIAVAASGNLKETLARLTSDLKETE
jgi:hypothetical protein